jgi:hypothetical protein
MNVSSEDIIGAFKIFLDRPPESAGIIEARLSKSAELNLIDFVLSEEFLKRPDVAEIILKAAEQVTKTQQ